MIPNYSEFVAAVSDDKGHLGPNLQLVVDALLDFWERTGKGSLEEEIVLLKALYEESRKWIKKKDGKSEFTKSFGFQTNYYNQRFIGRRARVASLAEEALKTLMELLDNEGLLTPELRGEIQFDIRKFQQKGKMRSQKYGLKGLSHGYELERESWLKSGKTVAVSGSRVHQAMTSENLTKDQIKALKKISNGQENIKLWKILTGIEHGLRGEGSVVYLKKKQRYQFMLFIEDGKFKDYEGNLADYGTNRFAQRVYAMDQYGNMFVYSDNDLTTDIGRDDLGRAMVNHSTMNSGRDVICAGMLNVRQGKLTGITNSSGHYKPTKENFYQCLVILRDEGLDLSETEVTAIGGPGNSPDTVMWEYYTAHFFLESRGMGNPDIKIQEGPKP